MDNPQLTCKGSEWVTIKTRCSDIRKCLSRHAHGHHLLTTSPLSSPVQPSLKSLKICLTRFKLGASRTRIVHPLADYPAILRGFKGVTNRLYLLTRAVSPWKPFKPSEIISQTEFGSGRGKDMRRYTLHVNGFKRLCLYNVWASLPWFLQNTLNTFSEIQYGSDVTEAEHAIPPIQSFQGVNVSLNVRSMTRDYYW